MLNRKLLALVLPAVAVSALVGSGFSAWYFNAEITESVNDVTANVTITDKIDQNIGTLTLNPGHGLTTLTLDQGGQENAGLKNKGIKFDASKLVVNFAFVSEKVFNNLKAANMQVKVTSTITFTEALDGYVKIIDSLSYSPVVGVSYSYYKETPLENYSESYDLSIDLSTDANKVNSLLEYKDKPTSTGDYDEMRKALYGTGQSITFSWKAEVVNINN